MGKNEEARRMGVQLAYHLIKDANSLDEAKALLEQRLLRTEQTKAPILIRDKDLRDFESAVKNNVYTIIMSCVFALLEKPEYGFTREQMAKISEDMAELVDTVYGGWVDFPDLLEYFKDEYDIDLAKYIEESNERLNRIENKLVKRNEFVGGKYKSLMRKR